MTVNIFTAQKPLHKQHTILLSYYIYLAPDHQLIVNNHIVTYEWGNLRDFYNHNTTILLWQQTI